MPITLTASVQITAGGPIAIQSSATYNVGAVETISVDLQPGDTDREILLQPGPATAVMLVALQCETGDQSVTYRTALGGPVVTLNGCHLFNGPSMAGLLGPNPTRLYFSSTNPNATILTIIVGREP